MQSDCSRIEAPVGAQHSLLKHLSLLTVACLPKINPSLQLSTFPSLSERFALILLSLQITGSPGLIPPHSKDS